MLRISQDADESREGRLGPEIRRLAHLRVRARPAPLSVHQIQMDLNEYEYGTGRRGAARRGAARRGTDSGGCAAEGAQRALLRALLRAHSVV